MFGIGLPELVVLVLLMAMIALSLNSRRRGDISPPQTSQPSASKARRIKILGWFIIIVTLLRLLDEFPFKLSLGGFLLGQEIWIVVAIHIFLLVFVPGTIAFGLLTKRNWARWGWIFFGLLNVVLLQLGHEVARSKGQVFMPIFGDLLTLSWIVSFFWLFKPGVAEDFKKKGRRTDEIEM